MTRNVSKPKICCVPKTLPMYSLERLWPQRCENDAKMEPPFSPTILSKSKNRLSSTLLAWVAPCDRPPLGLLAASVISINLGVMPDFSSFGRRPPQLPSRCSLEHTDLRHQAFHKESISRRQTLPNSRRGSFRSPAQARNSSGVRLGPLYVVRMVVTTPSALSTTLVEELKRIRLSSA